MKNENREFLFYNLKTQNEILDINEKNYKRILISAFNY